MTRIDGVAPQTSTEPDTRSVLAARPADPNDCPPQLRQALIELDERTPLEPGWVLATCEQCGMAVRLGPRQRAELEQHPTRYKIMDLICTAIAYDVEPLPIVGLGGA